MVSSYMLESPTVVGVSVFNLFKRKCKMTKTVKEVQVSLIPESKGVALSATDLDLLNGLVATLEDLDSKGSKIQKDIETEVKKLHDLLMVGCNVVTEYMADGTEKITKNVAWGRYQLIRDNFMNKWAFIRKVAEKSAERAWNRYFADTGLKVPQSDSPDAVRKRVKAEQLKAEMAKIADIDSAIQEAFANYDTDKAKQLINEKKARDKSANASKLADLKPLADEVIAFVKVCSDEKLLRDVKTMFVKSKTKALAK
jgi:hypothetical protein